MEVPARSAEAAKRDEQVESAPTCWPRPPPGTPQQLTPEVREALAARGIGRGDRQVRPRVRAAAQERHWVRRAAGRPGRGRRADRRGQRALPRPLPQPDHDPDPRRARPDRRVRRAARRIHGDGAAQISEQSPDSDHFDKGRLLFNLHRAAPAARACAAPDHRRGAVRHDRARPGRDRRNGRAAGDRADRASARARVARRPLPGAAVRRRFRRAARRRCARPSGRCRTSGPGRVLAIATLPEGEDPDSIARSAAAGTAIEALIAAAEPLSGWLWRDAARAGAPAAHPRQHTPRPARRCGRAWRRWRRRSATPRPRRNISPTGDRVRQRAFPRHPRG
jgi:DNA primase